LSKGALGGLTDTVGKTVSGAGKTVTDTAGSATKGVSDTTKGEFFTLTLVAMEYCCIGEPMLIQNRTR
jgi:hypothetical protein